MIDIKELFDHQWVVGEHVWSLLTFNDDGCWAPDLVVESKVTGVKLDDSVSGYEFKRIEAKSLDETIKGKIFSSSIYRNGRFGGDAWGIFTFLRKEDAIEHAYASRDRGIEDLTDEIHDLNEERKKLEKKLKKFDSIQSEKEKQIKKYKEIKY